MYILIDSFTTTSLPLQNTMTEAMADSAFLVFNDDRFLPSGFISMFDLIVDSISPLPKSFKDVYLPCVNIPEYYCISSDTNLYGNINHLGQKKGTAWFRRDCLNTCADRVERLDENGNIVRLDFYNRYGFIAYSDFYNDNKEAVSRSYYSPDNKPILIYSYSSDTYCLIRDSRIIGTFAGTDELKTYCMSLLHSSGQRMIPTTYNQISLLMKENLLDHQTDIFLFQTEEEYRAYLEDPTLHGESRHILIMNNESTKKHALADSESALMIRYVSKSKNFLPLQQHALTITRSDQIEGLAELAQSNPHITFHVAANTMVSPTLLAYEQYGNVKIYPSISPRKLHELFSISSFYLDINHYGEVFDAIVSAVGASLLLMGFEDTLHNPDYILPEFIFAAGNHNSFSETLQQLSADPALYVNYLNRQSEENNKSLEKLKALLSEGENL